jgi:chaperone modulatory protein CbpM
MITGPNPDAGLMQGQFLDEDDCLRLDEVCTRLQIEQHWVIEMVELGALDPRGGLEPAAWLFPRSTLPRMLAMTRLVTDLGVNLTGAAIILELVEERRRLLARFGA